MLGGRLSVLSAQFCCDPKTALKNKVYLKEVLRDFPGGAVVKNPPASVGDTGSIPGPGRSHTHGATKPVGHNYRACSLEPVSHNY